MLAESRQQAKGYCRHGGGQMSPESVRGATAKRRAFSATDKARRFFSFGRSEATARSNKTGASRAVRCLGRAAAFAVIGMLASLVTPVAAQAQTIDGTWSYETVLEPSTIPAGASDGAQAIFRAIFQANAGTVTSLSAKVSPSGTVNDGRVAHTVQSAGPSANFGWVTGTGGFDDSTSFNTTPTRSINPTALGCVADSVRRRLVCESPIVQFRIFAKSTANEGRFSVTTTLEFPSRTFTYTAVVNGADSTASTPGNADFTGTTLTVATPPQFSATTTTLSVAENTAGGGNVGAAVTATGNPAGETVTYTLGGTDAGSFAINSTSGQITVGSTTTLDHETKSSYEVVVTAADQYDTTDSITVTITVTNEEEAGTVTLPQARPQVGTALTAMLSDPDGVTGTPTWTWENSSDGNGWSSISGAAAASYTPVLSDVRKYLRATASYTDGHGPNKSAQSVTADAVWGPPAAPPGFGAAAGNRAVTLSWADPNDPSITGYQYQQKEGTGSFSSWMDISGSGAGTTSHTVTGLPHGTTYTFKIRAVGTGGDGAESGEVTATTQPNVAPVAQADSKTTDEDTPATIEVLINDTDTNGDDLTVSSKTDPEHGTVVIDSGEKTVTYTPNRDFNGQDTFTYTVTDGAATASATVTVTVEAVNDPPATADDNAETGEDEPVDIDVLANDTDVDSPRTALSVSAVTREPAHGTTTVSGDRKIITYAPDAGFHGTDTFEYTETDGAAVSNSATVTIKVVRSVAERINRVTETVVPEDTRARLASTVGAVTGRIEAGASGAPPAATVNIAGQSTLYQALKANARAIEDGTLDPARLLAGSSFTLPLGAAEDGGTKGPGGLGGFAVWGSGDYRNLSGGDTSAVEWEGEVWSAHLGADARLTDEALAGLALSRSKGTFDYTDHTDGEAMSGDTETRMTNLSPYVGWSTPGGVDLWGTLGYGWGELEIDDDADGPETSDLTQTSFAVGGGWLVFSSDAVIEGGATTLKLKAQISGARVEVEGAGLIEPLTVEVSQGRVAVEGRHAHKLAAGGTLTPAIEIAVRNDAGDGEVGSGVELGGRLRYRDPASGLTVEGHGRALLTHSGNYEEWGIGGLIRLDPGADKRGMSLSLVPAMGEIQSGVQRLWNDGVTDRAANDNEAQARLQAELGYGFGVLGGTGVLTPYSGLSLAGEGARRYSLGSRLEIGPSLNLSFEGERRETAGDAAADHGVMLRGQLKF